MLYEIVNDFPNEILKEKEAPFISFINLLIDIDLKIDRI